MADKTKGMRRLIIHDFPDATVLQGAGVRHGDKVLGPEEPIGQCLGCFGCWVKTPARCVIKDTFQRMGSWIGECDEIVLVSRCVYGGFSPFVKNVLDRSIPSVLPYFRIVEGEMHHKPRREKGPRFAVHFYGEDVTEAERETARKLVPANALNLCARENSVAFYETAKEAGRCAL